MGGHGWCGADSDLRGPEQSSWRFRLPCDLCERLIVVTRDEGGITIARASAPEADARLSFSDDDTAPFPLLEAG